MQQVKLPLSLNALVCAQKRLDYRGIYTPAQISRVAQSVTSVDSNVTAELSCYMDPQKLVVVEGSADIEVSLTCQRCGGVFQLPVHVEYRVSPVSSDDQAGKLPEQYDPIEVDQFGEISLLGLIEDELILALPIIPVHSIEHCEVSEENWVFGELPEEAVKPNPFSVLTSLKRKQ